MKTFTSICFSASGRYSRTNQPILIGTLLSLQFDCFMDNILHVNAVPLLSTARDLGSQTGNAITVQSIS